ncbi:MAG: phosphoribosyl-ATP diphosphatase [Bauldia sp.]
MSAFTLADLAAIIAERADAADPAASYTAKLLADGVPRCARKFGEEAVETIVAALSGDDAALTAEAGDALYHLLVLLQARDISLDAVMTELEKRTRQSGLAEKAARGNP